MSEAAARFRLYIAGPGPRSDAVLRAVKGAGDARYGTGGWALEVVDVRADPQTARAADVMLTPSLHRLSPEPPLRWLGDLSDHEVLARILADARV